MPLDNGEYGPGDDDCELAEEPPPKQPKFQLPDIALDAESEGWREDIFKALPRHVLGKRGCGDIPMAATCDEGKNWEPPEARGAVFLSARMRGQLAYLERARIEAAAYIKQTVSLEEGVLMNLKPLSKMAKRDLTILCTASGLSLSLPSGKSATKEDLVTNSWLVPILKRAPKTRRFNHWLHSRQRTERRPFGNQMSLSRR